MKFGEIYTYKNAEEAKQYIGKKGVFSDSLREISEEPESRPIGTLAKVIGTNTYPFVEGSHNTPLQFFRPILEEDEPLMTNRQLAEWLAKGNGECTYTDTKQVFYSWVYFKGDEDKPVEDYIRIRRWRDTEWMKPTKAIYEEDCK